MLLASIVVVAVLGMLVAWIASFVDNWSRDWTTNVAETSVDAEDAHLHPLQCDLSPQELASTVVEAVASMQRWSVIEEPKIRSETNDEIELKLEHRTLLMHFRDDVTVTIRPTDRGSILNARSKSRIGTGDLGQNPRNLRQLLAAVMKELERNKKGN